jgi:hypothetical protein
VAHALTAIETLETRIARAPLNHGLVPGIRVREEVVLRQALTVAAAVVYARHALASGTFETIIALASTILAVASTLGRALRVRIVVANPRVTFLASAIGAGNTLETTVAFALVTFDAVAIAVTVFGALGIDSDKCQGKAQKQLHFRALVAKNLRNLGCVMW